MSVAVCLASGLTCKRRADICRRDIDGLGRWSWSCGSKLWIPYDLPSFHKPSHHHVQPLTDRGLLSRLGDAGMRCSGSTCRDVNGPKRIRRNGDENGKSRHDHSNHSEPSGQMDGKRQGIAASPEPPDLVYCPNAHKEDDRILFGNGGGAGLWGEKQMRKGGHLVPCRFFLCWSCWGEVLRNTTAFLCGK